MQFDRSEEQHIIAATVRRAFRELTNPQWSAEPPTEAIAATLARLGLATPWQHAMGTIFSASTVESVALEAGRASVPYPITEGLVAACVCAHEPKLRERLAAVDGSICIASPARDDSPLQLQRGGHVRGVLPLVAFPDLAGAVLARAFDTATSRDVIIVVDPRDRAARVRRRNSVEPCYPVADIELDDITIGEDSVIASVSATASGALVELTAALAAAAEICGAAAAALDLAKQHLETRVQFGRPLSANQALRHVMATNYVRVEAMTAAVAYASLALDAVAADAEVAIRAAKHYASVSGKALAEDMLQVHGAIGFTTEYGLARLMKRVLRLARMHGTPRRHALRLFELLTSGDVDSTRIP